MSDFILAKAFANADGREQGGMLNSLARELYVLCRGESGFESQCYYISRELNRDGEALVLRLAAFIELRKKEIQP